MNAATLQDKLTSDPDGVARVFALTPQSTNVDGGSSVTFTVSVTGIDPISYQWRFEGTNLPHATNATYSVASVALRGG